MALVVQGKLNIIERKLKNGSGSFCVGELEFELGRFSVRHPVLSQFKTGAYQGSFSIERIYPYSYITRDNRMCAEICVQLDWNALRIMAEDSLVPSKALESAADEEAEVTEVVIKTSKLIEATKPDIDASNLSDDFIFDNLNSEDLISDLRTLEKLLAKKPAPETIKLDNSLSADERDLFKQMVQLIKNTQLYSFKPANQTWHLAN